MKKTSRILTVLALAASSVLFATPSHAVPTVNIAIDCNGGTGLEFDQPIGNGWIVIATITNCTRTDSLWPRGTTSELKTGSTVVTPTTAGIQGSGTSVMQETPQWTGLSTASIYVLTITLPDPLPAAYITGNTAGKNAAGAKSGVAGVNGSGSFNTVHFFTIDPSYVPSGGAGAPVVAPPPAVDCTKEKAVINSVTFKDDGTGTAGFLTWEGTGIDSILYTGPATTYPKAFNYGAFTSSWNGLLSNLNPDTKYEFDLGAATKGGCVSMKKVDFKTGPAAKAPALKDFAYWTKFVDTYVVYAWEAANMKNLMSKFDSLATSPYRSFIKVPTSRVSNWSAVSLTPKSCRAETNGVVTALNGDTCTVSYTISGVSKAPVTLVRDFKFTKFSM
jgi:hypothetical protein